MALVEIKDEEMLKIVCDKLSAYGSGDLETIEKIISFKTKALERIRHNEHLIYIDEIVDTHFPKFFSASSARNEVIDELVVHSQLWDEYLHAAIIDGWYIGYPEKTKNILSPIFKFPLIYFSKSLTTISTKVSVSEGFTTGLSSKSTVTTLQPWSLGF